MTLFMDPLYRQYVDLFRKGKYFESHEVLEKLWLRDRSGSRDFYKGLIQLAAALHHLKQKNANGANYLHQSAAGYLKTYAPVHLGLDVSRALKEFDSFFKQSIAKNGLVQFHQKSVPHLNVKETNVQKSTRH